MCTPYCRVTNTCLALCMICITRIVGAMFAEFFLQSDRMGRLYAWAGLACIVSHAFFSAYIKYSVNGWYTTFYDLLQKSGESLVGNATMHTDAAMAVLADSQLRVWQQLMLFLRIVAPAVIVGPVVRWIRSSWALRWRMALMESYMDEWDADVPPIEGASQRLHEDTQRFSKGVDSYLSVFLNSACTLGAFTPILVSLGARVRAPDMLAVLGRGWMFASALASALVGLGVAMLAGRHLVELEVANQRVEAELRRDLVLLETTPGAICVPADGAPTDAAARGGERKEADGKEADGTRRARFGPPAPYFVRLWRELRANYGALFRNFFALTLWLEAFDQMMVLAPYVLVAPLLFAADPAERITLGSLVQTSNR